MRIVSTVGLPGRSYRLDDGGYIAGWLLSAVPGLH